MDDIKTSVCPVERAGSLDSRARRWISSWRSWLRFRHAQRDFESVDKAWYSSTLLLEPGESAEVVVNGPSRSGATAASRSGARKSGWS